MPPDPSQVQQWLEQARAGDAAAREKLLASHRESLLEAVRRRLDRAVARRIDASDVVQEALLKADRRLEEYLRGSDVPFDLWLRGLARDRVIDAHRRHRASAKRTVDREANPRPACADGASALDLWARLQDPQRTPAAEAIRNELQRRLTAALGRLPDDERDVLVLRHVEQLTNSQTAEQLGLSPAAAGMRYLRAIRKLRSLLAPPASSMEG